MSRYEDHRELIALADKYEPEMERQYLRAAATLQAGVNLDRLTLALADGDRAKAFRAVLSQTRLDEAMEPLEISIRRKLIPQGGRLGAKILNNQR
jgi:hypothetical protein